MPIYKKLLIQQQIKNGANYVNVGNVVDTYAAFKVVCQEFPFKVLPKTRDLAKRTWNDEHGDDEYVSPEGLFFDAYDIEVKFLYAGAEQDLPSDVTNFINFICGRNENGAPLLAIYDEYTLIGRRDVRVQEVENELYFYNEYEIDAIASFKVKFKVNDPVTNVILNVNGVVENE